jgi:hypothetical protein
VADYPLNVDGGQTLTGQQFRVNSAGDIVAHPRTGKLYLVFPMTVPVGTTPRTRSLRLEGELTGGPTPRHG